MADICVPLQTCPAPSPGPVPLPDLHVPGWFTAFLAAAGVILALAVLFHAIAVVRGLRRWVMRRLR